MEGSGESKPTVDSKATEATPSPAAGEEKKEEQKVTAFEVEAGEKGVDYDRLIKQFGVDRITQEHLDKIEELTGEKPHRFLRRGIFFSHRSLDW